MLSEATRCLICRFHRRAGEGGIDEALFAIVGLFVLVSRGEKRAGSIVEELFSEHAQGLARLACRTTEDDESGARAKVIPFRAKDGQP